MDNIQFSLHPDQESTRGIDRAANTVAIYIDLSCNFTT